MTDISIRGRGRGRPRRQPAEAPSSPRRGPARAVRAVRVDTPPVVVEDVADSITHSVIQLVVTPTQFEPWFAEQGPAQIQQGAQLETAPVAQQIPVVQHVPNVQYVAQVRSVVAPVVPLDL